jgi:hypothetical protein
MGVPVLLHLPAAAALGITLLSPTGMLSLKIHQLRVETAEAPQQGKDREQV